MPIETERREIDITTRTLYLRGPLIGSLYLNGNWPSGGPLEWWWPTTGTKTVVWGRWRLEWDVPGSMRTRAKVA